MRKINDLDVSNIVETENDKIVKEKMKELKLDIESFKAFVPFDEWNWFKLGLDSAIKNNLKYYGEDLFIKLVKNAGEKL